MSYDGWGDKSYGGGWGDQSNQYSYDMNQSSGGFGQEQHFQSFDYSQPQGGSYSQYGAENYSQQQQPRSQHNYFIPGPNMMTPDPIQETNTTVGGVDDELPLLEELGIDPDAIVQKTLNVLNPLRRTDPNLLNDTDLAGPLTFCLAFGSLLLLSGKVHFGYIYGIGLLGCAGLYGLLKLMSLQDVSIGVVISVLGYCLLPMVVLAAINVLISLQGIVGAILAAIAIVWCSWSASKLFVTAFSMHSQQPLVAYPCGLFYAIFALITIF